MKGLALAGVVVVTCFTGTVYAHGIPSFTAEGYCLEVSEYEGGDNKVYKGCIEIEQSAYDQIKKRWAALPEDIQEHCIAVAVSQGENYSALLDCMNSSFTETGSSVPN